MVRGEKPKNSPQRDRPNGGKRQRYFRWCSRRLYMFVPVQSDVWTLPVIYRGDRISSERPRTFSGSTSPETTHSCPRSARLKFQYQGSPRRMIPLWCLRQLNIPLPQAPKWNHSPGSSLILELQTSGSRATIIRIWTCRPRKGYSGNVGRSESVSIASGITGNVQTSIGPAQTCTDAGCTAGSSISVATRRSLCGKLGIVLECRPGGYEIRLARPGCPG